MTVECDLKAKMADDHYLENCYIAILFQCGIIRFL